MTREVTGRHVLMMFVGGFGTIIAVNLLLAAAAIRTFPGLEVRNSYVASQAFEAERAAQAALGWTVSAVVDGGVLRVDFADRSGRVLRPDDVAVRIGRATTTTADRVVTPGWTGRAFEAPVALEPGRWRMDLTARNEAGDPFRQAILLHVGLDG